MVSYNPVLTAAAERELDDLDPQARESVTGVIQEVCETEQVTKHPKCKPIEGHKGWLRIRYGAFRVICELVKPELRIYRVGTRKKVYEDIDDLQKRVEA
jgi:mRNA-degrading endonuclease RelE of RelBE toxin-antitoxin system